MSTTEMYRNERLDHLGIVAGVCQEIGLAAWLDAQDPGNRQQVSVGTATVAMILNGLGFSNRQLYLVPQYFANKPVEHLLGAGISAQMLNDDCLGRTLDWLYPRDAQRDCSKQAENARRCLFVLTAGQREPRKKGGTSEEPSITSDKKHEIVGDRYENAQRDPLDERTYVEDELHRERSRLKRPANRGPGQTRVRAHRR